jgi:hypothetical protein
MNQTLQRSLEPKDHKGKVEFTSDLVSDVGSSRSDGATERKRNRMRDGRGREAARSTEAAFMECSSTERVVSERKKGGEDGRRSREGGASKQQTESRRKNRNAEKRKAMAMAMAMAMRAR